MRAGYGHAAYAAAMSELGAPLALPKSGGHLLVRSIPATADKDAVGCYPLFVCDDWRSLGDDLRALDGELVSVTLVSDPFAETTPKLLGDAFHRVSEFKQHVIVDLAGDPWSAVSRHHRYYARRALRFITVDEIDALQFLDEWMRLYGHLAESRAIASFHRFSRESFAAQFAVPGIVAFAASIDGVIVGMHLWYVIGDVAYSHLLAVDDRGYQNSASYALYWEALRHLQPRVRWLDLGSGAGMSAAEDGLLRFKRGWSAQTLPVYLCGRIGDAARYARNVEASGEHHYFPAYRSAPH
jgi:hypothetical protein